MTKNGLLLRQKDFFTRFLSIFKEKQYFYYIFRGATSEKRRQIFPRLLPGVHMVGFDRLSCQYVLYFLYKSVLDFLKALGYG